MSNSPRRDEIALLLGKIAAGQLIKPHLSRLIRFGWEPGGKSSVKDFDLLLNDWGIHHLHIDPSVDGDRFASRSGDLLAVIFRPEHAFVLDIITHQEWAAARLVETAVRTWPEKRLFLPVPGLMPGDGWTDAERQLVRKSGAVQAITVDGTCYISPTVMSSARTTLAAADAAAETIYRFAYLEENPEVLTQNFQRAASIAGIKIPQLPIYRVAEVSNPNSYGFGLEEIASGLVVGVI